MKKEFMRVAVLAIVLCLVFPVTAFAGNWEITVYVDGKALETDVPPMIENGRTLVPMRVIFEALGAEIAWDGDTKTITAKKDENTVVFVIDEPEMTKNGEKIALDVPAKIVDGRTLVPVRAVCDGMDAGVSWDEEKLEVKIVSSIEKIEGTAYKFNELSDNDYKTLTDHNCEIIRYNFEQNIFPKVVLDSNKKDMIGYIRDKSDDATNVANYTWNFCVMSVMSDIQEKSEDKYIFDGNMSDTERISGYLDYIYDKNLDSKNFFDVSFEKLKGGSSLMLLTFKTADTLNACKYIGVVVNSNNTVRYFTAETDVIDKEYLYFCEVNLEKRGTIGKMGFEKSDFIDAINLTLEKELGI